MNEPNIPSDEKHAHLTRQLWCLVYAQNSLIMAKETAEQYLALSKADAERMKYTFVSSAVVSYCMPFITNRTLGELPKKYSAFSDDKHRKIHEAAMHARNTIYAHIDSTANSHHFQIVIKMLGQQLDYGYRPYVVSLQPVVFPDLIDLCVFQIQRIKEAVIELMPMILPPDEVGTWLHRNQLSETVVSVRWPGTV